MKAIWDKVVALWNRLTSTVKVLLIVALVVILGMGSCRVIRGSISVRIAKVEAQLKDAQKARNEATASLKKALDDLKAVQAQSKAAVDAANKVLADLARQNAKINADLAVERAKTKAMPNDALAVSLGTYIGTSEIFATAAGSFSLTRIGAENSRDLFLAGDAVSKKLLNCESARDQDGAKLTACASELGQTTNALEGCKQARLSDAHVIKLLQNDLTLQKAKNRWMWVKAGAPAVVIGIVLGFLVFHK